LENDPELDDADYRVVKASVSELQNLRLTSFSTELYVLLSEPMVMLCSRSSVLLLFLILASISVSASQLPTLRAQQTYDRMFDWGPEAHLQAGDFVLSPDFQIDTPHAQFEVSSLGVRCSMRNQGAGVAIFDIGAIFGETLAYWSKPPPSDSQKDAMHYRGVAFGPVDKDWFGQPFFVVNFLNHTSTMGDEAKHLGEQYQAYQGGMTGIYNTDWIRYYGNSLSAPTGVVHLAIVVWTGQGANFDLLVDACSISAILSTTPATTKQATTNAPTTEEPVPYPIRGLLGQPAFVFPLVILCATVVGGFAYLLRKRSKIQIRSYGLICANCGHENPETNQFCGRCVHPLRDETRIY